MSNPIALNVANRIESVEGLDAPARLIGERVRGALKPGPAKRALSGAWLGHALHPLLTDVPIGTFTSAVLLDFFGGESGTASDRLILFGLAATPGTILTGWSDWADAEQRSPAVRRAGIVHAVSNAAAVGLMAASYRARKGGRRASGKGLSLAGMTLMGAGGWLGGHLSYKLGAGVEAGAPAQGAQAQAA
jgi:uncharacterized membrane protein